MSLTGWLVSVCVCGWWAGHAWLNAPVVLACIVNVHIWKASWALVRKGASLCKLLSFFLYTHTHTHTERKRDRYTERNGGGGGGRCHNYTHRLPFIKDTRILLWNLIKMMPHLNTQVKQNTRDSCEEKKPTNSQWFYPDVTIETDCTIVRTGRNLCIRTKRETNKGKRKKYVCYLKKTNSMNTKLTFLSLICWNW